MDPQRPRERSRARKPVTGTQPPSLDLGRQCPRDLLHERHRRASDLNLECELPTAPSAFLIGSRNWSRPGSADSARLHVHLAHRTFPKLADDGFVVLTYGEETMRCCSARVSDGSDDGSDCSPETGCCPVLELRQYTLKPGQRDVLMTPLFERHFVCGVAGSRGHDTRRAVSRSASPGSLRVAARLLEHGKPP